MPSWWHLEPLDKSLSRLPGVLRSIPDIIRNPAANPLQTAILLGIVLVLALILVLTVFLTLFGRSAEDELLALHEEAVLEPVKTEEERRRERAARTASFMATSGLVIIVLAAVWLVGGVTTGKREVCESCHTNTSHAAAVAEDPHKNVDCVECHEGGGAFARVSVNVVTRVEHVVLAEVNPGAARAFGKPVASDGCLSCHRQAISGVFADKSLKVRVAHEQPLEAGAQCVDCHELRSGTVTAATVGMSPCLRCHDGKQAKAECSTCHDGDPSQAIRPSVAVDKVAAVQVPNPQCSTCHKDMTKCNACHGISMPHSTEFKMYGHARQGAIDVWDNDGRVCSKCHYQGHNSCQQQGCHQGLFPSHPSPAWKQLHGDSPWNGSEQNCACHRWNPYDHNGQNFCAICHAAKPKGK